MPEKKYGVIYADPPWKFDVYSTETVEAYRRRVHGPEGEALRNQLARWAATVLDDVTKAWPEMPEGIEDRDADVWEALLAVADAAGGTWPERARVTAVTLVTLSKESTPSLGIRLLKDLKSAFGEADHMFTDTILNALHKLDESPWADIKGKPLNDRGLASRLKPYDIKPKLVRIGEDVSRGYTREDFHDAWQRYLGPPRSESVTSVTSVTPETPCACCGQPEGAGSPLLEVADGERVAWVHRGCLGSWGAAT
jgi:Protein of unknown function (DUF3631)